MKTINERLLDIKTAQVAGTYIKCPRCGRDTMKPDLYTNALSRVADIMICDACGLDEAMRIFMRASVGLSSWDCMQPIRHR